MGLQEVIAGLGDNPYFGAGFGLFGIGVVTAAARRGAAVGAMLFRRHCMTTVEVTCKDKSFPWLLQWISEKGKKRWMLVIYFERKKTDTEIKILRRVSFDRAP